MTDAKETARKWAAEQIEDWEHRATQAEGECLNRSAALYRRDAEHLRALLAGEGNNATAAAVPRDVLDEHAESVAKALRDSEPGMEKRSHLYWMPSARAAIQAMGAVRDVTLRNALMWAFDRLSIDGGMSVREQRRTMREIGNVLCGRPSAAATYKPNDWDDSAALHPSVAEGRQP